VLLVLLVLVAIANIAIGLAGFLYLSRTVAAGLAAVSLLLVAALVAVAIRLSRRAILASEARQEANRRARLAEATHELRTPLAIIRGEAEAIADGVHPASAENLGRIIEATAVVERLVGDLGVLSAGDPGEMELRKEPVDLELLVGEALSSLKGSAEAAGVELEESVPAGLAADLDPVRVRAVLVNLLTNSIRHTPEGGKVSVSAARPGGKLEIAVRDTGSGIDAELLPRVFDRFVKGPDSPGSGLGLAIAREVVEAHGGRIAVESEPGKGTLVRILLPA
jgi:two-component system, OmpR family, sensor histidine kinase BaeS